MGLGRVPAVTSAVTRDNHEGNEGTAKPLSIGLMLGETVREEWAFAVLPLTKHAVYRSLSQ